GVFEGRGAATSGRSHEDVADAAHGANALGVARVVLELASKVADVDVERAVHARVVLAEVERVRELAASHDASRAARELDEEAELERGEREIARAPDGDLLRRHVDDQIADDDARRDLPRLSLGAPKDGPQARKELARVERLGNIIVGAEVETCDAI